MYLDQKSVDWSVFLIGGHSGSGKTTAANRLGLALGVPWMMVDDLRLAFQRARVRLPKGNCALYFDKTPYPWRRPPEELCDLLIAVSEVLSAPLEVVIENHVDQGLPIVIEGDGIIPSLLSRTPVVERLEMVRTAFIVEPDESEVLANVLARGRYDERITKDELRNEARSKWLYGQWLAREAARYDLPVIQPRPWGTLVQRLLELLT